ncbi:RHS repeat-associated core domain-containing protein, partial [Brevibacillus agri]
NRQTMMGKDYQLVYTDHDEAIDAIVYPSRSAVSGSAPALRVDYTYDNASRLSAVTIPGVGTTSYTYDMNNNGETNTVSYPGQSSAMQKTISSFAEITGMNHADGWSETNGYDLFGNITSQKRGGANYGTFAYDKLSRIKEETIQGNTRQYVYDRRGNRQIYANAPADSTRSYELKHDLLNRLIEYKDAKGTTTYTYYPGGLRATKQQTGSVTDTTHYVYLNGQVIEELTQDGRVKARNVFGNQLIWRKDYTTNQEGTYYYNSHGDVVKIKGPSGNVLNTYEYDIWGNLIADKVKETMTNPFAYAGEMYDKESGFYYLRARYYDPKMGRFVSEDTVKGQVDNPLTLNRYTYTHNNPVRYIDPTGHDAWLVHGTFSDNSTWKDDFVTYFKGLYKEDVRKFEWSGDNDNTARVKAAQSLAADIMNWRSIKGNEKKPIRLIGHSHGGNVSILAANVLEHEGIQVETLVTIATPVRELEYYLEYPVGQHLHVYNERDGVQVNGGSVWLLGEAKREFTNAANIKIEVGEEYDPIAAHSAMHSNVETWKKYITPYLEKFYVEPKR